jgi:hypothetical protein
MHKSYRQLVQVPRLNVLNGISVTRIPPTITWIEKSKTAIQGSTHHDHFAVTGQYFINRKQDRRITEGQF